MSRIGKLPITVPAGVEVFEITGPLFFGAAYKFKDAMEYVEKPPRVLIVRMRKVPIIDGTGIQALRGLLARLREQGTRALLSRASDAVTERLREAGLLRELAGGRVVPTVAEAIDSLEEPAARASVFSAPRGQPSSPLLRPEAPAGAS